MLRVQPKHVLVCVLLLLVATPVACFGSLCLYVLVAQDRPPGLRFWNNSGHAIQVVSDGRAVEVAPGRDGSLAYSRSITIRVDDGHVWEYQLNPLGGSHLSRNTILLQLESDGSLYVLPPADPGVRERLPAQPNGYPLLPRVR
jgi:hypothetical protein